MNSNQWQPIETAPKDIIILVFTKKKIITSAAWYSADNLSSGWYEIGAHSCYYEYYYKIEPTHWMNLPSAPKEKK